MSRSLEGKVALVTGGSRGINAGIVRWLASYGAAVAFTFSASEDRAKALVTEVETRGGKALAIRAEGIAAVRRAIAQTVSALGRLDILTTNAEIVIGGMLDEYTLADFDETFAVNVRDVFAAIHAARPHLTAGSRIITTSSIVGFCIGSLLTIDDSFAA
jgi:3-oxoacyl-[acyl-carrier protein] reductase